MLFETEMQKHYDDRLASEVQCVRMEALIAEAEAERVRTEAEIVELKKKLHALMNPNIAEMAMRLPVFTDTLRFS